MLHVAAAVATAPGATTSGWMMRTTGRCDAGRCHARATIAQVRNATHDTAPAAAAESGVAPHAVVGAAASAARTAPALPTMAVHSTPRRWWCTSSY
jgi:hypothetical protein